MSDLYIMRWPSNLSAVYVNGATIRYFKNRYVYYANEVMSPGQIICSWYSATDYLDSGIAPSLPLLQANKSYELDFRLKSDHALPTQMQIKFYDHQHQIIQSLSDTENHLNFVVPDNTVAYEINLINLKHSWIMFDYLAIREAVNNEPIVIEKRFKQHYDWIHATEATKIKLQIARLIISTGPKSLIPITINHEESVAQIFVFTDGNELDKLIADLRYTFQHKHYDQIILSPGVGYYAIAGEITKQIEDELNLKREIGG